MFVKKFGNELSNIATLEVPNGRVWLIGLTNDGTKIWFLDGWHDFVQYHSISIGNFLVFKYLKNSTFQSVPVKFVEKYLCRNSRTINLQVPDGRVLCVKIKKSTREGFRLQQGWIKFSREENLKQGDIVAGHLSVEHVESSYWDRFGPCIVERLVKGYAWILHSWTGVP
ncbi:hypothetical protein Patl1_35983 [Pistacia atlantica]|nr:hypothetical protein Patl1_35983 [Pistacia atlantica]